MKITIQKEVFRKFNPKFRMAFIHVQNLDNKSKLKESKHLLKEAEKMIKLTFNKETLKNHHLISPWSVAREHFGKEAKHYNTSVERLLKRVLKGRTVATKDVLTNILRYLSLKYIVPFGIDDPAEMKGELVFKLSKGKEKVGVLRKLKKNALYYKDAKGVLGTKLDYWKSRRTKLVPQSFYALIHFEILPPLTTKQMNEIVKEANSLIRSFCNGKTKVFTLTKKKNSVVI